MADKVLSQAEVDALLKGVADGAVETEAPKPASGVRAYDLTSQERIIRGRMPGLEIVNERFARLFHVSLSGMLRRPLEFMPHSVQPTKFGEFMRKMPLPSSFNVIKLDPLRGHALIVLDARTVFLLIDFFFGGSGQTHVKTEGREFTSIEQRFIAKLLSLLLADLQKAWVPLFPLRPEFVRAEMNPQFAMVVVPTEVVVTVTFRLELQGERDAVHCDIHLCLPYPTIEPIREKLYGSFQSDQLDVDRGWTERFKAQLSGCNVAVSARLGSTELSVEEIIRLSVGDVVVIDKGVRDDIEVQVEGRTKFKGRPGVFRGNPSVQVTRVFTNEEEADGK